MLGHIARHAGHRHVLSRARADRHRHRPAQAEHQRDGGPALPRRRHRAATPGSRSTTWASTSAPSSRRSSAAGWRRASSSSGILRAAGISPESSWHWGFGMAAVGMFFGLVQYLRGWKHLGSAGRAVPGGRAKPSGSGAPDPLDLAISVVWRRSSGWCWRGTLPHHARGAGESVRVVCCSRARWRSSSGCSRSGSGRRRSGSGSSWCRCSSSGRRSSGRCSSRRDRRSISSPSGARGTASWATPFRPPGSSR